MPIDYEHDFTILIELYHQYCEYIDNSLEDSENYICFLDDYIGAYDSLAEYGEAMLTEKLSQQTVISIGLLDFIDFAEYIQNAIKKEYIWYVQIGDTYHIFKDSNFKDSIDLVLK